MSKISLDKDKIRFLLVEGIHSSAVKLLNNAGYSNVETSKIALSDDDLIQKAQDVHFLGIRSRTQLTQKVLSQCPKLIAVGCFCIGTNQVDLAAAQESGICVFNAPYSNTRSVAELVISERRGKFVNCRINPQALELVGLFVSTHGAMLEADQEPAIAPAE